MKYAVVLLFAVFLFVAIFGLPMLLSHSEHHVGCPLSAAGAVMCESTIIEHVSMWNSMFASVIASFILVLAFVLIATHGETLRAHERVRFRYRATQPRRPTLIQELYARGIHNRKEPYAF